jgi:hypothetical protein
MPNRLVEKFVPIAIHPLMDDVPGNREHGQQEEAADGVCDHFADGVPD